MNDADVRAKIYLTYPFGKAIEAVIPVEDPDEVGAVIFREAGCIITQRGAREGVDWHRTIEGARKAHLRNVQSRIDACLDDLKMLTGLLAKAAASSSPKPGDKPV